MTASEARKTVKIRWDRVRALRALAIDAAGAAVVLAMLVIAWFLLA